MPWLEESTMDLRRQFVQDVQSGAAPATELCQAYGISRKTGYRWLTRFETGGVAARGDQSRRPRTSPHATIRAGAGPARGPGSSSDLGPAQAALPRSPAAAATTNGCHLCP